MSKRIGAIQIDYIIAAGIFIAVFAYLISYTTGYYTSVKDTSDILVLRSEAFGLQGIADREPEPATWPELQPDSGMVLLMHFNNDTLDYSGQGNNGTPTNGVNCSSSVTGRFKSGCSFDGVDDYVLTSANNALDNYQTGIVEAWIKSSNITNDQTILMYSTDDVGTSLYEFLITGSKLQAWYKYAGTSSPSVTGSTNLSSNQWYHVAFVADGTNMVKIYVNGVAETTTFSTNNEGNGSEWFADVYGVGSYNHFIITGAFRRGGTPYQSVFNGTIDEVAIYNRSLTAAEVMSHYQQGLQRIGLQSYAYRFYIHANYTQQYRRNQTSNISDITNERINFSLSSILPEADVFSVAIYNSSGSLVPYQISDRGSKNITFSTNIAINASQWFTVYVDDDTVFPDTSTTVTGGDNITETVFSTERISLLQYEKIRQLSLSNYTDVRDASDIKNNFNIKIVDTGNNQTFMEYGGTPPRRGNVIALQRYIIFQNATAAIRNGRFIVQSWK